MRRRAPVAPRPSQWFSLHTHSQFSVVDGMTKPRDLVHKAVLDGRPALGMTDHGNMAASTQLYKACKAEGILPYPGVEIYLLDPNADDPTHANTKRYHLCLNALDLVGYMALVKAVSLSHTRPRFSRYPRFLLSDLAELGKTAGEHISITTGCFFGLVQQTLVNEDWMHGRGKGLNGATRIVKMLAQWFPHTFVEVQHHNITHEIGGVSFGDTSIVDDLFTIAHRVGLPVIATQDSHYTDQREKVAHALMKRMVYGGEEDEFPGDSFHLASQEWVAEHYSTEQWAKIEEGCAHLLGLNKLAIPALDTFKAQVPSMDPDPNGKLYRIASAALRKLLIGLSLAKANRYMERLKEELSVIKHVGVADYFLLVLEVVEWCREHGVCIEARGSANGSLVCFLLGITQIDPLKWNVPFERFLSRDRIKPPDIDIDIEDVRRQECLHWLMNRFTTIAIGTWAQLGMTLDPKTGDLTGSVFRTYQGYLRRKAEDEITKRYEGAINTKTNRPYTKALIEQMWREHFARTYGWIQTMEDVKRHSFKDWRALVQLSALQSVFKSYGTHAGGVLLGTDSFPHQDYIPSMLVANVDNGKGQEKGRTVTQFDMDDVEEWGLLKLDLLGQATLTVMRIAQELIMESDDCPQDLWDSGDPTDFTWIPDDDLKACALLREGRPDNGIFHFEGYTKAKGGKELGIKSTRDAVLCTAIYMPGAKDGGAKDEYLKRRATRATVTYLHPIFERVLKETLGVMVYQDQPLSLLREMGMDIASVNLLYKVLKDSGRGAVERNRERLAKIRKEFDYLCAKHGIPTDEAWHMVTSFDAYAMNKAHAAGYGVRSYRCAYLKAHFPVQFMTALLAAGVAEKQAAYLREVRRLGIRIMAPDVNLSDATFSMTQGRRPAIRKGLSSIKGIGDALAQAIAAKGPYESIDDLVRQVKPGGRMLPGGHDWLRDGTKSGAIKTLDDAGALDSLEDE